MARKQKTQKKTAPASKKQKSKPENNYTAKDIYVLEGLDPVRKRPGMYIGSTGPDGLHHLIWEVTDNALDEVVAGYAHEVAVFLLPDNIVSVSADGRGIPGETHAQTKKSALETVMTTLHAGGKFGGESYKIARGLHGVGVSVVNALSEWLRVEVRRDGALWVQEYRRGKPKDKVKKKGEAAVSGTAVTFKPDFTIFQEGAFEWERILEHLRQQAYLTTGVRIVIRDERENDASLHKTYAFYFEGGVRSYVRYLNRNLASKHDTVFFVEKEAEGIHVEIALQYTDDLQSRELSFANNVYTPEGGMHLTGFRTALTRTLNDYARNNGYLIQDADNFTGDDVREGLTAVISLKLPEPQFEGQTKAKLGNPEVRTVVDNVFAASLTAFLEEHPQDARQIAEKVILALKARKAAKAAKDTILRKGALEGLALPGKLADCQTRSAEESELFVVEGDSAGGSAKMARNRRFQAILPLRGKILNVERARLDKTLSSKEIRALVIALGAAIGDELDVAKIRYHKIVLMTDADVDGSHIRTLLLTLFYRYYRPVIEAGYLYIAQPPLYRLQKGKTVEYAYDEAAKAALLKKFGVDKGTAAQTASGEEEQGADSASATKVKGVAIQRYKGLGEMNPDQLWETTMDPEARVLLRVTIEDAEKADRVFDTLMGAEVAPRKLFIQTHAKTVQNLDI